MWSLPAPFLSLRGFHRLHKMLNGPYPQARGDVSKNVLCAYFYCWFVCILQNIHETEKECVFSSSKDAKSKRGVMILMNSSTCQFENVQGEQMKGWICLYAIIQWFKTADIPFFTFEGRVLGLNNRQPFNMKHYQARGFLFFIFLIYHCFLVCLWSFIPLTKIWSFFPLSPKLILYDGNYFSPFFPFSYFIGFK